MIQEPKVDSCRPSARRGERQRENPPALRIVRTVKRRTPTFYCREHTTGIRFSGIRRKYFGNKNLRPSGNQFKGLLRILIKKPCFSVGFHAGCSMRRIRRKWYEKVINNDWLCFLVRGFDLCARRIIARTHHRLLAGRRPVAGMFQRRAAPRRALRSRSETNSFWQPRLIPGCGLHRSR
jgi:hypothetical protein